MSTKNVLVLGHNGMLGNAVTLFLSKQDDINVLTISSRWEDVSFNEEIKNINPDFIVNCIGAIPQKKPTAETYKKVNFDLPVFLESLGIKVIHPTTDCEFSGTLAIDKKYTKKDIRDALDDYGKSKSSASELIENSFKNTKMIRTSIIGHEVTSHVSLLDWLLKSEGVVNGYTDHYWNGITTLHWAKICYDIINDWNKYVVLNQYGTEVNMSKYEMLVLIKNIYNKNISINPITTGNTVNKCLLSDSVMIPLEQQLMELRAFYKK